MSRSRSLQGAMVCRAEHERPFTPRCCCCHLSIGLLLHTAACSCCYNHCRCPCCCHAPRLPPDILLCQQDGDHRGSRLLEEGLIGPAAQQQQQRVQPSRTRQWHQGSKLPRMLALQLVCSRQACLKGVSSPGGRLQTLREGTSCCWRPANSPAPPWARLRFGSAAYATLSADMPGSAAAPVFVALRHYCRCSPGHRCYSCCCYSCG
jgi:hypothetical protein